MFLQASAAFFPPATVLFVLSGRPITFSLHQNNTMVKLLRKITLLDSYRRVTNQRLGGLHTHSSASLPPLGSGGQGRQGAGPLYAKCKCELFRETNFDAQVSLVSRERTKATSRCAPPGLTKVAHFVGFSGWLTRELLSLIHI